MAASTQQVLAQYSARSAFSRAVTVRSAPIASCAALRIDPPARDLSSHCRRQQQPLSSSTLRRGMCVVAASTDQGTNPKAATLEGTPQSFPISEDKLIKMAQHLFDKGSGIEDESLLADDFRFEFPVISLDKEKYLGALRSFDIKGALPDLEPNPYHWRVDPYEPNRVWFTTRVTGTHTGTLKFGGAKYEATGRIVRGAPECASFVFNEAGKCTSYTGGYVMDRRVGNTNKMGALFGILSAIGAPVPEPGSLKFKVLQSLNSAKDFVTGIFSSVFGSQKKLSG